jgi:asparagine synthase (glutamine-hydrolysing)
MARSPAACRWPNQEELLQRFDESVRLRLMGEVPVGVFLSGGIDSNAIASAVSRVSTQPVRTFTIGFDDPGQDESRQAREAARVLGTEHHELVLAPDLGALLPKVVAHFDEPFGDPSAIPTWCLAEMASGHITVALSGEGGDEAFAGYPRYRKHQVARRVWLLPRPLRLGLGRLLQKALPDDMSGAHPLRGAADLLSAGQPSLGEVYGRWLLHCDAGTAEDLYAPGLRDAVRLGEPTRLLAGLFDASAARDPVNAMLDVDQQTYLADDLLPKLDVTAMAHSVEGRSPFLDHEFAGFVAAIPGAYSCAAVRASGCCAGPCGDACRRPCSSAASRVSDCPWSNGWRDRCGRCCTIPWPAAPPASAACSNGGRCRTCSNAGRGASRSKPTCCGISWSWSCGSPPPGRGTA